jgi:hypothetical protein
MLPRLSPVRFAVVLAVAAGIVWFLWSNAALGDSCGYHGLSGAPSFPAKTALALLVGLPAALTALRATAERCTKRRVAGFTAVAALLAGAAVAVGELVFAISRHCFA